MRIHQIIVAPAIGWREGWAIVVNSSLKPLLATGFAVGWRNFKGNGGCACKKAKPLVIVQFPARTARIVPRLVTVVDFGAISIQVFTNDRTATVAARVWKSWWRALGKKSGWKLKAKQNECEVEIAHEQSLVRS